MIIWCILRAYTQPHPHKHSAQFYAFFASMFISCTLQKLWVRLEIDTKHVITAKNCCKFLFKKKNCWNHTTNISLCVCVSVLFCMLRVVSLFSFNARAVLFHINVCLWLSSLLLLLLLFCICGCWADGTRGCHCESVVAFFYIHLYLLLWYTFTVLLYTDEK